jgi:hypothetical protein
MSMIVKKGLIKKKKKKKRCYWEFKSYDKSVCHGLIGHNRVQLKS